MKAKKILITGASGMLGTALCRKIEASKSDLLKTTFPESHRDTTLLDITNADNLADVFEQYQPEVVFNCGAYTDVDGAQSNIQAAMKVNADGPGNLAQQCKNTGALLVHVGTDYVFNGKSTVPYKTGDKPCPNTIYGKSKLEGEKAIIESGCKSIIIRTSWLFGPNGKNFVATIINLARTRDQIKVVNDQTGCPTYTLDLADAMIALADKKASGIFHFCNPPACTWYDFAREIVKTANLECEVLPCTTEDFPRPAPRPAYSVMDLTETIKIIGDIRTWKISLDHYIKTSGKK